MGAHLIWKQHTGILVIHHSLWMLLVKITAVVGLTWSGMISWKTIPIWQAFWKPSRGPWLIPSPHLTLPELLGADNFLLQALWSHQHYCRYCQCQHIIVGWGDMPSLLGAQKPVLLSSQVLIWFSNWSESRAMLRVCLCEHSKWHMGGHLGLPQSSN